MDKILPMPHLKTLDLSNNNFGSFDAKFMKIIENGTILKYAGNPLNCDCYVRPLKRWLSTLTVIPEEWSMLNCASPRYLAGKSVAEVGEELMGCSQREIQDDEQFDITPDLKFRRID